MSSSPFVTIRQAQMNIISTWKILAAVALTLSAATEASSQGMQPPTLAQTLEPSIKVHPSPEPRIQTPACVCTMQHDPVCARTRQGRNATYSNACRAACDGATVVSKGAC